MLSAVTPAGAGRLAVVDAKNDWQPAFYQVLPDSLERYRAAGFDVLCIGQEGIVDLRNFTLQEKSANALRYRYHRFSRLGYRAKVYAPPARYGTWDDGFS